MARAQLHSRETYRHWHRIETLWADNDVYGHVNNTVHYRWFDTVVNRWLIAAGLLNPVHGNPIGLVAETGCRYAESVSFPDAIDIGLAIDHLGFAILVLFRKRTLQNACADSGAVLDHLPNFACVVSLDLPIVDLLGRRLGFLVGLVQLLGGHGYTKEHPVERWYRDLRAIGVAEGVVVL